MTFQFHAGHLRYHDFPKLRELHRARQQQSKFAEVKVNWKSYPFSTLQQTRSFLNLSANTRLRDTHLKLMERTANENPKQPDVQYQFVSELSKSYPEVAVERYTMQDFIMDERSAGIYLLSMSRTNNYSYFSMEKFIDRLQAKDALKKDAIIELAQHNMTKGLSKAKQVAAVLNILGNPALSNINETSSMAAMVNNSFSRGQTTKNPLFVQIQNSSTSTLFSFLQRSLLFFIVVSALSAVLDEKGVGRAMGMNSSKHIQEAEGSTVKFSDVKGVSEAKAELQEIVAYLKDPSKFTRLGGNLPRGLLLTGPPGTGKTLLAKAIAGEAEVPFFFASGSQFEEVYVGLGAKRIRELFQAAKKKAPSIIFIDEIDAVGGNRKLKDQSALKMTLNELLVQLDGFDENNGVIVIGATNFMESLDTALLRPGRFDKHVEVPLPDVGGRKEILELYAKKTKLSKDVDLNVLARGTTGFSGADLYNLMNQAALIASVKGLNSITMSVLEYAKDKILMGAERKTAVITAKTAKCTAYHEAGHALVAVLTDGATPIHKATIMPRGSSLGMVMMLPEGDQTSQSFKEMLALMDVSMGGRVAEELIFGEENITSGAFSDIMNATKIARNMVTKFGYSEEVGIVYHHGEVGQEASSATRSRIDEVVKKLTQEAYDRAKHLLKEHSKEHRLLAETLLEYETLTGDEVRDLIKKGTKPKRPIINTEKGARGNTSIVTQSSGGGQPIQGWGSERAHK
eukprot:CAMPEP_0194146556 /NCGR_PEP_ID=MMETSP0152-20130528/20873_1 /TAXON_ID=1049557 /ORGANISM="Thalassiothrix antarctica, Strain L6-D1" /LENGTH=739 /DNA_ID=CAMNT_0038847101 /DNA_START=139 /DNA_END=2358 /DNA_ORIENTATION=+